MAHIQLRPRGQSICYRAIIRPKKWRPFTITFHTLQEAKEWLKKHEKLYIEDPHKYRNWIKINRESLRRNGIFHNHVPLD